MTTLLGLCVLCRPIRNKTNDSIMLCDDFNAVLLIDDLNKSEFKNSFQGFSLLRTIYELTVSSKSTVFKVMGNISKSVNTDRIVFSQRRTFNSL